MRTRTLVPAHVALFNTNIGRLRKDGCRRWRGAYDGPYGSITAKSITIRAHIVAVLIDGRTVKKGEHVHHTCHRSWCVSPEHLVVIPARLHPRQHRRFKNMRARLSAYRRKNRAKLNARSRECKRIARTRLRAMGLTSRGTVPIRRRVA